MLSSNQLSASIYSQVVYATHINHILFFLANDSHEHSDIICRVSESNICETNWRVFLQFSILSAICRERGLSSDSPTHPRTDRRPTALDTSADRHSAKTRKILKQVSHFRVKIDQFPVFLVYNCALLPDSVQGT